jgi:hypothetical protein
MFRTPIQSRNDVASRAGPVCKKIARLNIEHVQLSNLFEQ